MSDADAAEEGAPEPDETQPSPDTSAEVDESLQPEEAPISGRKQFGTFGGVFTPTLLTILGVIMYLREGWIIGNAGLLGGLVIAGLNLLGASLVLVSVLMAGPPGTWWAVPADTVQSLGG